MIGSRDRFKEAPWYNPDQSITIGGLGSIGSWLTLFMGRLIDKIYVYDYDEVEAHNMGGQFYGTAHIDMKKEAATKMLNENCWNPNTNITTRGRFEEGSGVTPVCFACFDNMLARKQMFESWKSLSDRKLYIDGRLTAEEFWVYGVTPENQDIYEEQYLPLDSEIEDLPCSFKSTTHISAMLASYMTVIFTNYCHNNIIEDIRSLPFEVRYSAAMTMHKISTT